MSITNTLFGWAQQTYAHGLGKAGNPQGSAQFGTRAKGAKSNNAHNVEHQRNEHKRANAENAQVQKQEAQRKAELANTRARLALTPGTQEYYKAQEDHGNTVIPRPQPGMVPVAPRINPWALPGGEPDANKWQEKP